MILSAGSLSLSAQQFIFKTYTVADGLVSNSVRRIYQDKKGFIWIATWEGLSKYDGNKFTNYTIANGLSHNMVNDIYESPDERLYVAENNGAVDVLFRDMIDKKAAFHNVVINQFYQTQNNRVVAVTDFNGVFEIKNGALLKPPQSFPGSTYSDLIELNDSLLIGASGSSLHILNERLQLYSEMKQPVGTFTLKIYKDSKGRVWVGTTNGLKLISPGEKDDQHFYFASLPVAFNIPVLKNNKINDILEDANGDFWIATTTGLVKIYSEGNWQLFSEKDGLPSTSISRIYQDKEKNIWIGTILGLAKLVTKNIIRIYTNKNELNVSPANFLVPLKNDLFLTGSESGVQFYNCREGSFSRVPSQHNFLYTGIVQNSQPLLFYGINNKIGIYDSVHRRIVDYISVESPKASGYCSVIDTNGIIFNGMQEGLFVGSKEKLQFEKKLPYRITRLLIDKKGYLWVGTWENGLYRIHYTHLKNESRSSGINLNIQNISNLVPDKNIRCLFEDSKGNIWVGTRYQGLIRLNNNNTDQFAVQQIGLQQGLMSNWIHTISEDTRGNIWIGHHLGIEKLIAIDKSFRVFNFSWVNNFFATIFVILPTKDHSLWLVTSRGLAFVLDGETEKTPPLPVYIASINIGDTAFYYSKYLPDKKVQLKHYQNHAQFEFSAPGFINEKKILYSYRLLGSTDTTWSKTANLHSVSYTNLQSGNYHFQVRTLGWNGEWGIPANFLFSIRPPYWQTWWFYSLVGLLILSIFYAFYFYRIRQLLRLQKVRNRIATDLHDDIGSTLTNISILTELSKRSKTEPEKSEAFLNRIREEIDASGQALDDIIWSVNTKNDSLQETAVRMRRYAAELFDADNISYELELNTEIANKKISMEQRRDLFLIFKEALNNIHKHAFASTVKISLFMRNNNLWLIITDNGKGFEPTMQTNRNGIKNMTERVRRWNGKISMDSKPGQGSKLEIILPNNN